MGTELKPSLKTLKKNSPLFQSLKLVVEIMAHQPIGCRWGFETSLIFSKCTKKLLDIDLLVSFTNKPMRLVILSHDLEEDGCIADTMLPQG